MSNRTGYGSVGVGFDDDDTTLIGIAYERANEASEFGLPENYEDPQAYCGKAPDCQRIVGVGHRY